MMTAERTEMITTSSEGQMEFQIPLSSLESFKKSISKLQRRAEKMGFEITMEIGDTKDRGVRIHNSIMQKSYTETRPYVSVIVVGEVPIIEGWRVLACLEFSREFGVMIKNLPGVEQEIPARYMKNGGDSTLCEHCHTKRNRLKSYILQSTESNEFKQIGSTCIKDFTGHASPEQLARYWQIISTIDGSEEEYDDWLNGSNEEFGEMPLVSFLSEVSALVGKFGYMSISKSEETGKPPTVIQHEDWIFYLKAKAKNGTYGNDNSIFKGLYVTDADVAIAEKTIEWTKNFSDDQTYNSSYNNNVRNIARAGTVPNKHKGFAASMIQNYLRHNRKEINVENNEFYPCEVGDKITVEGVEVVQYRTFTRDYTTHLYKFQKDGYLFTWFSSRSQNIKEGDIINFTAKVKKLDDYKGIKQTVITRAKVTQEDD